MEDVSAVPKPSNLKKTKLSRSLKVRVKVPNFYCRRIWYTIGLGLVHVMIGAVNMAAMLYAVKYEDAHVIVCTIAYHFFSVEAILSLNHANGWSLPMRRRHRKGTHVFLQICGMFCAVSGTTIALLEKGMSFSAHGITGTISAGIAAIALLSGTGALFGKSLLKTLHMAAGILTFAMSSISLCFGFFAAEFRGSTSIGISILLAVFVAFYTVTIFTMILVKVLGR